MRGYQYYRHQNHNRSIKYDLDQAMQQTLITKYYMDELEPVLDERNRFHEYIANLDNNINKITDRKKLSLKNKHIRILKNLEETKKRIKYFEIGLMNIDDIMNDDVEVEKLRKELNNIQQCYYLISRIYTDYINKIFPLKTKYEKNIKILEERKHKLVLINHQNVLMSANIIHLRNVLATMQHPMEQRNSPNNLSLSIQNKSVSSKKLAKVIKNQVFRDNNEKIMHTLPMIISPKGESPTLMMSNKKIDSSLPLLNSQYLKESQVSKDNDQTMTIDNHHKFTTESTLNSHKKQLDGNTDNLECTQIFSDFCLASNSLTLGSEFLNSRKILKSLKASNQIIKDRITSNSNMFTLLKNLLQDCLALYHKQLCVSQKKSKQGMNGSLLFTLLDHDNRGEFMKELNPISPMTMKNFFKTRNNPFVVSSENETVDVVYKNLKKMVFLETRRALKDKSSFGDELIEREKFMNFEPIQIMGVIFLKPEIFSDVHLEFDQKLYILNAIIDYIKNLKLKN